MAGTVRFTSHIKKWTDDTSGQLDLAVLEAATDTHRVAGLLAPKGVTRNLSTSGRIKRLGIAHYAIIFGGGQVPYARLRHYVNKKTPGSLRYLERAGDSTARNFNRYLRGL